MYLIYWLINESNDKTYIGFTDNIDNRIKKHETGDVKTTKDFGKFKCYTLEKVETEEKAVIRERYWKSCAGRKKLKLLFDKIIDAKFRERGATRKI